MRGHKLTFSVSQHCCSVPEPASHWACSSSVGRLTGQGAAEMCLSPFLPFPALELWTSIAMPAFDADVGDLIQVLMSALQARYQQSLVLPFLFSLKNIILKTGINKKLLPESHPRNYVHLSQAHFAWNREASIKNTFAFVPYGKVQICSSRNLLMTSWLGLIYPRLISSLLHSLGRYWTLDVSMATHWRLELEISSNMPFM